MKYAACLTLAILSYLLSTDLYTPSMPDIAQEFAKSSNDVQTTMTVFLMGAFSTCFISGIIADHFGKKRTLLIGLALATVGSLIAIVATSLPMLLFARFLQGISCAASVVGFAVVQDLYTGNKVIKILGVMGVMLAGVPALAPALGGYINAYLGWRFNFLFLLLLFMASFIVIWKVLPASLNTRYQLKPREIIISYKTILWNRQFLSYALLSPYFNAGEWFYLTFLPFYFQNQIGFGSELYGLYIGTIIIWFAAGSYIGGQLVKFFSTDRTIEIGLFLGFFSVLLLAFISLFLPKSAIAICIALSFYLYGFGMLFPSSVAKSLSLFKELRTLASSIRMIMITGFAFLGSLCAEYVDDSKLMNLMIFLSVCVGVSIVTFLLRKKETS